MLYAELDDQPGGVPRLRDCIHCCRGRRCRCRCSSGPTHHLPLGIHAACKTARTAGERAEVRHRPICVEEALRGGGAVKGVLAGTVIPRYLPVGVYSGCGGCNPATVPRSVIVPLLSRSVRPEPLLVRDYPTTCPLSFMPYASLNVPPSVPRSVMVPVVPFGSVGFQTKRVVEA